MISLPELVTQTIEFVIGENSAALHEPSFSDKDQELVRDCIKSTFVSSVGKYVDHFEADLAAVTGAKHAVAVSNGTAALQVALQLAGVVENDEVLMPSLTFVATANAASYIRALPHFVDIDENSLGLDPHALRDWLLHTSERTGDGLRNRRTGRRIKAIVPMHTFGHPCDLERLLEVASEFSLVLVEDAAESLGSYYHGRHTGTFGLLGTMSFNGNKIITTGGGGAILTNDTGLANHAKHITTTAKKPHRWDYVHDEIGYNFRMPNLNAALGCAQLEKLPDFLASKRLLFKAYNKAFARVDGVRLMEEPEGCESNYWLQTLILNEEQSEVRDAILETTNNAGFMTRPSWGLLHELAIYKYCPRAPLPISETLGKRIVNLPSSSGLI